MQANDKFVVRISDVGLYAVDAQHCTSLMAAGKWLDTCAAAESEAQCVANNFQRRADIVSVHSGVIVCSVPPKYFYKYRYWITFYGTPIGKDTEVHEYLCKMPDVATQHVVGTKLKTAARMLGTDDYVSSALCLSRKPNISMVEIERV